MIKLFRLFFSKSLFLAYSGSLIITFLLGLANVYSKSQQSAFTSNGIVFISIFFYFILFFVLESNRMYQFFRTTNFRLLPISTGKMYLYNLIFSGIVGFCFFIGNMIVGVIMNNVIINIPFQIDATWIEIAAAALDIIVLFLTVQVVVYGLAVARQFVQKKYQWIIRVSLFIVLSMLLDHLPEFSLDILKGSLFNYLGLESVIYFGVTIQIVVVCIYAKLSVWIIDRYVEAGDQ